MGKFSKFKCKDCGYTIACNPTGFTGIMAGLLVHFKCDHCKEIVSQLIAERRFWVRCPNCGEEVTSTWNPIDGKCPKCNGTMKEIPGHYIMVD